MIYHPNFNPPWLYFITSWWRENVRFLANGWTHIHHPWQHLSTYSEESGRPNSYHSNITYHMTLNIIFSVVGFNSIGNQAYIVLHQSHIEVSYSLIWLVHAKGAQDKFQSNYVLGNHLASLEERRCKIYQICDTSPYSLDSSKNVHAHSGCLLSSNMTRSHVVMV